MIIRAQSLVGSRTILGAATKQSDYDTIYLVWSKGRAKKYFAKMGYKLDLEKGSRYSSTSSSFLSMRLENQNAIITSSKKFYNNFYQANEVAKLLILRDRTTRIKLFQFLLYNKII